MPEMANLDMMIAQSGACWLLKTSPLLVEPTCPVSVALGRERCRQREVQAGQCQCLGVLGEWLYSWEY